MEFSQLLRERYGLSDESIRLVTQRAEYKTYARKETIISEGDRNPWVYFVERGSVRCYVMREAKCVIFRFAFEGDPATPELGSGTAAASPCTITTLEPARLVRILREELETLFGSNAELANWARRLAEETLIQCDRYFAEYSWMDKSRQYERLLHDYPQLLQRVPLKELAAYLSVTPQTLSRIRAGIR